MDQITTQAATDTCVRSGAEDELIDATNAREEAPWDRARLVQELKAEAMINCRPRLALAAMYIEETTGAAPEDVVCCNGDAALIVTRTAQRVLKALMAQASPSAGMIAYEARYLVTLGQLLTELARDIEREAVKADP